VTEGPETLSVLIVDDDFSVVRTLQRVIAVQGYRTLGTTDPLEACRIVQQERIDILISDIEMPGMNGLELITRVRRSSPETLRLLLTGAADLPSAVRAINEGEVFRFLAKPWDATTLVAVLSEAAAKAQQTRRHAESAGLAERRRQLVEALERHHQGITRVERTTSGTYRIDPDKVTSTLAGLPAQALRDAWQG
jgi:two-component system, probable response regulator PhcQ